MHLSFNCDSKLDGACCQAMTAERIHKANQIQNEGPFLVNSKGHLYMNSLRKYSSSETWTVIWINNFRTKGDSTELQIIHERYSESPSIQTNISASTLKLDTIQVDYIHFIFSQDPYPIIKEKC